MPRKKEQSFEESLSELETIVASMESGDMGLSQLMENYNRGIELSKKCLSAISKAEQAIDICLRDEDGELKELELDIEGD